MERKIISSSRDFRRATKPESISEQPTKKNSRVSETNHKTGRAEKSSYADTRSSRGKQARGKDPYGKETREKRFERNKSSRSRGYRDEQERRDEIAGTAKTSRHRYDEDRYGRRYSDDKPERRYEQEKRFGKTRNFADRHTEENRDEERRSYKSRKFSATERIRKDNANNRTFRKPESEYRADSSSRRQTELRRTTNSSFNAQPQRPRFPHLDDSYDPRSIGKSMWGALRGLSKDTAERVAKHIIMMQDLVEEDPQIAWQHAQAATRIAGRIGAVREAAGICAYHIGEYQAAVREIRTFRRISGLIQAHKQVEVDALRALGKIDKAKEVIAQADILQMPLDERIELIIVKAAITEQEEGVQAALTIMREIAWLENTTNAAKSRYYLFMADLLETNGDKQQAAKALSQAYEYDPQLLDDGMVQVWEEEIPVTEDTTQTEEQISTDIDLEHADEQSEQIEIVDESIELTDDDHETITLPSMEETVLDSEKSE